MAAIVDRLRAMNRAALAGLIDHTLLRPEATPSDIAALCREADAHAMWAVCVSPARVGAAARALGGGTTRVAAVVGFPSGAHAPEVAAVEAARALADGAAELDMVVDLGLARAGDWGAVRSGIAAVRAVIGGALLKVILETAALEPAEVVDACRAAESAGADFVKTSTGFHPAGGATVADVRLMAETVGGRLGVKASGGIGTAAEALAMLDAGATRLGLSRSLRVLDGL
jgi:deoxyribose-phosphate aldolase